MRSLFVLVIWFGLAIGVTEIVAQMLSIQAVRTVPRGRGAAPADDSRATIAVSRSRSNPTRVVDYVDDGRDAP